MAETNYIRQTETESIMGDRMYLCYFITQTEEGKSKSGKNYGVGIDMYTQTPSERTDRVRKTVDGLFKTKLEAELFVQMLYSSYVTPTSLDDVIEDNIESELA